MSEYRYETIVRDTENDPVYTFAEVQYGKIVAINQHWVPLKEYRKFFEPGAFFLDITGVKIDGEDPAVGDAVINEGGWQKIIHIPQNRTFEELKSAQIERLKLERDKRELEPIEYNSILFDADEKSLARMEKARQFLEDNQYPNIEWTTADNSRHTVTVADFKGINTQVAIRSNALHVRYNQLKDYINNLNEIYASILPQIDFDWDMEQNLDALLTE